MKRNLEKNITRYTALRHYACVMAFAVLCVAAVTGFVYFFPQNPVVYAPQEEVVRQEEREAATTTQFARSIPVRLVIPKINLDTTFVEPLGLNSDQTVSVPNSYEEVGWYTNGATPGEVGPAVILGHVDSYQGPAIFYNLGKLEEGDEVEVTRADGTTAVFVVTTLERQPQTKFPTERVYGPIDFPGLRLVTCSGVYNRGTLRYSHNLIVYAVLKESTRTEERPAQ